MKENKLTELSLEFSADIINLVKKLKGNHETIISNQIGRSGTSIGANIYEAQYAHGKKDLIDIVTLRYWKFANFFGKEGIAPGENRGIWQRKPADNTSSPRRRLVLVEL